ncbi:hypothetical protein AMJ57_02400 [Parcubacteria bacterium SG8_24]|nr:MAG: hypothetical protein AMJ57_02400 [Parcubacteria bacterium SG8_24]
MIPELVRLRLHLPEIQAVDPREVITAKLQAARREQDGRLVVEDTSLYLDCLGGRLPGPLIKWFIETLKAPGIFELADKYGIYGARAAVMIGYTHGEKISFFEGDVTGRLVAPRGDNGFGFDPIFQPDGSSRTFAEMTREEKCMDSHRKRAFQALQRSLEG